MAKASPRPRAAPPADQSRVRSARGPVLFTIAFAVAFTASGSFSYRGHRYFTLFDDAMISMRYASNLAHGHGLVWNPGGAHVEGYTNFLWAVWMAVLHLVPGVPAADRALLIVASGLGLLIANLLLVRAICRRLAPSHPEVSTAALWLTATSYPLLYWTLRGMEVGLIATLTTAMALLVIRWRETPSGRDLALFAGASATAVLTRTDAVLPAATAAFFLVLWAPAARRRWATAVGAVAIGGTLALHTLFRLVYYGDPLPNTYYLKLGGAPLVPRFQRGLESLGALSCAALLPLLLLAALHVWRGRRSNGTVWLLVALFGVPAVYSVYVGGDAWEWLQYPNRYLSTGLTLLIVLAGFGVRDLIALPDRARARCVRAGAAALVLGLVLALVQAVPTGMLQYLLPSTGDEPLRELLVAIAVMLLLLWEQRARRATAGGPALLVVAAIVVASGQGLVMWSATSGLHVGDDNTMAIYGLELRQATAPDATIAVVWAGAGPYFSQRPSVDLLGKSDRHLAKEPMRKVTFYPGHTKWDYAWSIGRLQPDVVAGLVRPTATDLRDIASWGYDQVVPGVYVRRSSTKVDRVRLAELLSGAPRVTALIARDL